MSLQRHFFSSQLFNDPECWFGQGLNLRPPTEQTSALPTELTRQYIQLSLSTHPGKKRSRTLKRMVGKWFEELCNSHYLVCETCLPLQKESLYLHPRLLHLLAERNVLMKLQAQNYFKKLLFQHLFAVNQNKLNRTQPLKFFCEKQPLYTRFIHTLYFNKLHLHKVQPKTFSSSMSYKMPTPDNI